MCDDGFLSFPSAAFVFLVGFVEIALLAVPVDEAEVKEVAGGFAGEDEGDVRDGPDEAAVGVEVGVAVGDFVEEAAVAVVVDADGVPGAGGGVIDGGPLGVGAAAVVDVEGGVLFDAAREGPERGFIKEEDVPDVFASGAAGVGPRAFGDAEEVEVNVGAELVVGVGVELVFPG